MAYGTKPQQMSNGDILDLPKIQRKDTPQKMAEALISRIEETAPPCVSIKLTTAQKIIKQVTSGNPKILLGLDAINEARFHSQ